MKAFLAAHAFWVGMGVMWAFAAFVGGMPEPDSQSGKGYRWLYGSMHLFAANLQTVSQTIKLPTTPKS